MNIFSINSLGKYVQRNKIIENLQTINVLDSIQTTRKLIENEMPSVQLAVNKCVSYWAVNYTKCDDY